MLRYSFVFLLLVHGLIHLMGFVKAFNLAAINQLTQNNSKVNGVFWLTSALLFTSAGSLFFLKKEVWWLPAAIAVLLSQYLIFTNWQDAKFGTIANVLIAVVVLVGYSSRRFSGSYKNEVRAGLEQTALIPDTLFTEADLRSLPEAVQKYIRYTGALNQPKVKNFKIEFEGQIRKDEQSEWMPFTSVQFNFVAASTRLFFMNATMKHLPVAGFHSFKNGEAFMDIRLFSVFKVQYQTGKEMGIAETVTFFNDMCCMAPATLIDKRIQWLESDRYQVRAAFTNNGITITARLYFNDEGALINFVSDDRFAVSEGGAMKQIPWSTPLKDYIEMNGHRIAGYTEAIYEYSEGRLCYGTFRLVQVEYNCK